MPQHLRWREEQNIDKIKDEDWGDIARFFPMFNDQYDKQGRPGNLIFYVVDFIF